MLVLVTVAVTEMLWPKSILVADWLKIVVVELRTLTVVDVVAGE